MATELKQASFDEINRLPLLKEATNVEGEMRHRVVGSNSEYQESPVQAMKKQPEQNVRQSTNTNHGDEVEPLTCPDS